jgi:hypothetical protein
VRRGAKIRGLAALYFNGGGDYFIGYLTFSRIEAIPVSSIAIVRRQLWLVQIRLCDFP